MNKKFTKLIAAIALLTCLIPITGWGQTRDSYTYTFESSQFTANPQTKTLNSVSWTFTGTTGTGGDYFGYDGTKGQQFGSGSKPYSALSLSTSEISGTITNVVVNTSGANSIAGTVAISVGGTGFTCNGNATASLTNTATNYTFTGSASGNIIISWAQTSSKAIYVKSIEVTYSGGGSGPTVSIPTTPIVVPSTGGSGNLDITYSNMDISEVDQFDVVFYDTDGTTPLPSSDYPTWVGQSFSGNDTDGYKFNYSISNYTGATDQVARLKVYALDDDYTTEAYSDLLTITQTTPPTYSVTYNANGGSGTMTDPSSPYFAGAEVTLLSNTFTAPEGKMFDSWLVKDADDDDVTVTAGKFTMPAKNVTVTAQWVVDPDAPQYEWVLTSIGDLTGSDVFVIVGTVSSTNYAMTNDNGTTSAPVASTVTIANGKLSDSPAANLRWNISGNSTDGYTFYPNGDDENWLYCNTEASSGSNNNLRVGTGGRKLFIAEGTTFKTKDDKTARFLNVYEGTPDWRGYISNSTSTTTTFYKRQEKTTEPSLYAENVDIACEVTAGAITYTLENPVSGGTLSAEITAGNEGGWLTLGTVGATVPFTCTVNTGAERTATVTLTYTYNTTETVTTTAVVTQGAVDFATLPFTFDGGKNELPTGMTGSLGSDYGSSPKLKFDGTGKYLIMKLSEAPLSLSYDMKVNGTYGNESVFDVLISDDGTAWTPLSSYTTMSDNVQTITHINLTSRYIKWIYTNKDSGNVALGNIKASADYEIYSDVTVEDLTIPSTKTCTVYSPATLNVTGTLTNEATSEAWNNLVIKDGAQLKTPNEVNGTVEKNITGYGTSTKGNYVLLATPATMDACNSTGMWETPTNAEQHAKVDFYSFDQSREKAWVNFKHGNDVFTGPICIEQGQGYLYANKNDVTLTLQTRGYVAPPTYVQTDYPFVATNVDQNVTIYYNTGLVFTGVNLIGNPFTCKAYLKPARAFYRMNSTGDGIVLATDNAINVCEGIFVVAADDDDDEVTFTTTAPSSSAAPSEVNITLNQAQTRGEASIIDVARISFSEGNNLPKLNLLGEATMLYIPQGSKDYSVVCSNGQGEMPVNFKAAENGSYTLSFSTENAEMDYMHLIDNMTGADVDLLQTPSYTFNARTTDYASRFRLVFSANSVNDSETGSETFAFFNGSEWVVNASANATLQVVDMMGRIVLSTNGANTVSTNGMAQGVYVMRLVNGNDVKTQKIVVQ